MRPHSLILLALLLASFAAPGFTQDVPDGPEAQVLKEAAYEQNLGASLPERTTFIDHEGQLVQLPALIGDRPAIVVLGYYECPMLCSLVHDGLLNAIRPMEMEAGRDYSLISVSISPEEDATLAARQRQTFVQRYGRGDGSAIHFLTGSRQSISRLASTAGFRFARDPQTGLYSHAAGFFVVTPDETISRYFLGLEYDSVELEQALLTAQEGETGGLVEAILLRCFHYDPRQGKYGGLVMAGLRGGAVLTLLALGITMVLVSRRRRASHASSAAKEASATR